MRLYRPFAFQRTIPNHKTSSRFWMLDQGNVKSSLFPSHTTKLKEQQTWSLQKISFAFQRTIADHETTEGTSLLFTDQKRSCLVNLRRCPVFGCQSPIAERFPVWLKASSFQRLIWLGRHISSADPSEHQRKVSHTNISGLRLFYSCLSSRFPGLVAGFQ